MKKELLRSVMNRLTPLDGFLLLAVVGLYFTSFYSYLVFHALAEIFRIGAGLQEEQSLTV